MKKYKLLKDLPRAKAGSIVIVNPVKNKHDLFRINLFIDELADTPRLGFIEAHQRDEWLEEIKEPKSIWNLKEGDKYYYIDSDYNCIVRSTYIIHNFNKCTIESGNAFLSEQEAEKELEKRKAIAKIKKWCWENGIDDNYFGCDGYGWYFVINRCNGSISISLIGHKNGNPIGYFSKENAEEILKNFEEELKIILN